MAENWYGQKLPGAGTGNIKIVPIANDVNVIVGEAPTVIIKPASGRGNFLWMVSEKNPFRVRIGDHSKVVIVAAAAIDNGNLAADTFVPGDVNTADDEVTLTAHGFATDDGPFQLTTGTTLPAGLSLATDYFLIVVDVNTVQFSLTVSGAAVGITDAGVGTHTLNIANAFTATAHGYVTGAADAGPLHINNDAADPPVPLTDKVGNYWVIRITDDVFQLAASAADAAAGTEINITDDGTGDNTFNAMPQEGVPTVANTEGNVGCLILNLGTMVVPSPNIFTVKGYASDSALAYFWV